MDQHVSFDGEDRAIAQYAAQRAQPQMSAFSRFIISTGFAHDEPSAQRVLLYIAVVVFAIAIGLVVLFGFPHKAQTIPGVPLAQ